jgi:hypothetical protein
MIHDLGQDHETMSGYNRNPHNAAEAEATVARVRKELGL